MGIFSVALVANSAIALLARAFYAQQNTRTPVRWAIGGVIINVALALLLAPKFGVLGVAIATSMAAAFQAIGLSVALHLRTHIINRALLRTIGLTLMNAIVASLVARLVLEIGQPLLALRTVWGVLGQGLAAGGVGIAVYLALGLLTDSQDVALLRAYWQRYSQPLRRMIRRP